MIDNVYEHACDGHSELLHWLSGSSEMLWELPNDVEDRVAEQIDRFVCSDEELAAIKWYSDERVTVHQQCSDNQMSRTDALRKISLLDIEFSDLLVAEIPGYSTSAINMTLAAEQLFSRVDSAAVLAKLLHEHAGLRSWNGSFDVMYYGLHGGPHKERDLPGVVAAAVMTNCAASDREGEVIVEGWQMAEYPEANCVPGLWTVMWQRHDFLTDDADVSRPDQPMTLWRGASPERANGLAWTANKEYAYQYANQRNDPAKPTSFVWSTVATPDMIRGRLVGRNEDEYVVLGASPQRVE